jgi:Tol biopolymer transport system component
MPSEDDELRDGLSRWHVETDPEGAFDRVASRRARRRTFRRVQVAALALTVVAGTVGGSYALSRLFRRSGSAAVQPGSSSKGRIAFVSDRDGNDEIYTMNPDGSDVRRLTNDPAEDLQPAWSPDGSQIAFISDRGGGTRIWVMGSDGSHPHAIPGTEAALARSQIAWTPGQGIAYAGPAIPPHSPPPAACVSNPCTTLGADILIAYPDGQPVTDLIPIPGTQLDPAWGPDGTTIEFVQQTDAGACVLGYNLHSIMIQPDALRRLAESRCVFRNSTLPATSPVDTRSAFVSGDWIYATSGGDARNRIVRGSDPSWSADGSQLAFVTQMDGQYEISTVGADGSGQHAVTLSGDGNNRQPAWSPPTGSRFVVSPTVSPSRSPSPSPSPTPSPNGSPACSVHETKVFGDFDGDGKQDVAVVGPTECLIPDNQPGSQYTTPYAIDVVFDGGPTEGIWPLPDCDPMFCAAFAAADLDANGTAEVLIEVAEGASTVTLQAYEIPQGERGPDVLPVAPPGNPEYPPDQPIRLLLGGSVTHQDFVTCVNPNEVIATADALSQDASTWTVTETHFTFDGSSFAIASVNESQVPTDPSDPQPPAPAGQPCWIDANRT